MPRAAPLLAAVLSLLVAQGASAAPVLIKLGTVAPKGSRYDQMLQDMAQKWSDASGGQVKVRIYPGGVAGSEGDMVRKIGVGQLQGAALTVVGMHDITSEPQALNIPMLVNSDAELTYVLSKLRPELDAALARKGFIAVNWANAGSPRIFSTFALNSPADLAKAKVWAWDGDPAAASAWKAVGFQPVVLSSTDIIPSLETGLINAVPEPPLFVFVTRTFEKANHMLDMRWGMIAGATVIRKETWDKIAPDVQTKLRAIADDTAKGLSEEIKHLDDDAVTQMKKQGLIVEEPIDLAGFQAAAEKAWPAIRGKVVSAAIFDQVKQIVTEFRAQQGK